METVFFTDPETQEQVEFAVEEETSINGVRYLLVSEASGATEDGECDAYILKEISTENDESLYRMVDDDVEFAALAKVFAELTDEDTTLEY